MIVLVAAIGSFTIAALIVNDRHSKIDPSLRNATLEEANAGRTRILAATGNDEAEKGRSADPQTATPAFEAHGDDRTITEEQKSKFISLLRDAPRGKVIVSVVAGDREAYLYAIKLASLLRQAGFESPDRAINFLPETEPSAISGVVLFVSGKIPIRPHALAIKNALDIVGIRSEFLHRETPGREGDLQIAVYAKR